MDIKEAERVVIAKPVASKPNCSKFRSFSELLAGAINASPPNECLETAVPAIRPKTVRFRPAVNRAPVALVSSLAEVCGTAVSNSSGKDTKPDIKQTVVYKPQAKLVSKTTVSLLSTMGHLGNSQQWPRSVEARVQHSKQDQSKNTSQNTSNFHRSVASNTDIADHSNEPSRLSSQNQEDDSKTLPSTANTDRPSYDGYNWRKYGQKKVKGSEYPRSYYKCTHPNCPVKKKVERSFDGQIAEIVYKGEHNHPKPQPPKRSTSGTQGLVSDATEQDTNIPLWSNQVNARNEGSQGRVENQNGTGGPAPPTYQSKAPLPYEPAGASSLNAATGTSDNSCGLSSEGKGLEADDEEPRTKKRRTENQSNETAMSEPRVVVQSSTDSDIFGDGFRWRKYGQKVVKGNPYPRSYYRCTSLKCNVRKHVERTSDDPGAFVTTYEGKHNHEMPSRSSNP